MLNVVGMISGTSYDAIESVAVELDFDGDTLSVDMREHTSTPYPDPVRKAIAAILPPATTTIDQVCELDTLIGQCFADAAGEIADSAFGGSADVIASHGQTVFHWVDQNRALGTLQIGQPAFIAERTGATVVHDLRIRDIVAGGQGAPLASLVDVLLLNDGSDAIRGSLNLGGIANVTIVASGQDPVAFDTGPASAFMDAVVSWRTDGRETYDVDGRGAAQGTVDAALLAAMLDEPYYRLAPPKSTGKELFHLDYLLDRLAGRELSTEDLLATMTALTAEVVANDLKRFDVTEVVAAGGGTRNPVLMAEIAKRLPDVEITTIDTYGIAQASKEALTMALIGFLTVHGLPGTVPTCTGAKRATVLGSIVPGLSKLELTPGAQSPSRMRIRTPLGAGPERQLG
jgi:anhydro-N-acetylmuramic acid kinase